MQTPEIITARKSQLHKIGMAETGTGFQFRDITIPDHNIETFNEELWTGFIIVVDSIINKEKKDINNEIRTDKQKLQDFVRSLEQITGPELKSIDALSILENILHLIRSGRDFGKQELEKMSDQ